MIAWQWRQIIRSSRADAAKLLGICVARNESDVIAWSLEQAAKHYDLIAVVDCSSTDDTRKRVEETEGRNPAIVYVGEVKPSRAESVRSHVFAAIREYLSPDWWIGIVDADEVAHSDLRAMVLRAHRQWVDHIQFHLAQFYLTKSEFSAWMAGDRSIADRSIPIEQRRKYYRMSEKGIRLFRYLPWQTWRHGEYLPHNLVRHYDQPALYRHYQYRDPEQMRLRLQTRKSNVESDYFRNLHPHWYRESFLDLVVDNSGLEQWTPGQAMTPDVQLAFQPPRWYKTFNRLRYRSAFTGEPKPTNELLQPAQVNRLVSRLLSMTG